MEEHARASLSLLLVALLSAFLGGVLGVGVMILATQVSWGSAQLSLSGGPVELSDARVDQEIHSLLQEEAATIAVVDRVAPAVVSVNIEQRYEDLSSDWKDPSDNIDPDKLVETGGGSGFFVTEDGYIVTNRHVVSEEGATLHVVTYDGKELLATVVAVDPFLDLALLDVEGSGYPIVTLGDSDKIRIGSTVIAIGNTLAEFKNTVTKGVVSGMDRRILAGDETGEDILDHAIQTDAAINPGNSGGPLINLLGEVVGVNSAVSTEGQSIGFAIPVNEIKRAITDVRENGRIIRPWLGVRYLMVNAEMAKEKDLPSETGAWILVDPDGGTGVVPESPAASAGLMEGDIILSVNDIALDEEHELGPVVSQFYPGDVVMLHLLRKGEELTISVTLGEVPSLY